MTTLLINSAAILLLYAGGLYVWTLCLRLGLRWVKAEQITNRKVWSAAIICQLIAMVIIILAKYLVNQERFSESLKGALGTWATIAVASTFVIGMFWVLDFSKAFRVYLVTLLSGILPGLVTYFILIPYGFEAFIIQANSMAPTVRGRHIRSHCPLCGETCVRTPDNPQYSSREDEPMICPHYHAALVDSPPPQDYPADRVIVSKYVSPRRWDIVAFRVPDEPSVIYIKRLIGVPGETIVIRGGKVYANGVALKPPAELREIRFTEVLDNPDIQVYGSPDHPAMLGEDEYYVLGEFTDRSRDSRLWTTGADGHPPYAVPGENILGVVTQIYWPPERWKNLPQSSD